MSAVPQINGKFGVTDLQTSLNQTRVSPQTPNSEFLAAIFGRVEDVDRPFVVSIPGAINETTVWHAGSAWSPVLSTDAASLNWFFTLSTYSPKDGKYKRQKAQFCRSYGVMLDDIGTKAAPRGRLDGCPPSYLIETSAGNFQAGYLFDVPCADLAQVEALQESLVKAGLCDPGAKGPSSRLGRLPNGINGKYQPMQNCKLVEWYPNRRYSIDQIVEQLELDPIEAKGSRQKMRSGSRPMLIDQNVEGDVYRPRPSENAVISTLRQRGLYKKPLGSGRHDITCPWLHEHTDGVDHGTAYFEPIDLYPLGGFKCQHSHGANKKIGALLEFLSLTTTEAKHKPTIRVAAGELHRIVDAAERELAASGRVYQRGGLIVSILTDPGTGTTCIKPISANGLMFNLSSIATWERFDARSRAFVVTDPPTRHVSVLFDAESYQHLPVLRGVARQPYLRQDGSLMNSAGFDTASGMFGAFDERRFQIPKAPDRETAILALGELQSLLDEFSFAKSEDLSAALAMMLTAAVRPSLSLAPMGHIKAPQIASGKSYLQSLIAAFASPSNPSTYPFPSNDEECSKLLLAALLEAPAVLVFDNLTSDLVPYKSLCSALTEEYLTGRILGVSKTATVPTQALFLSSGNSVDPVRDMTRRALTIALDPAIETPASRRFKGDPLSQVRNQREKYVSLALTIVRAYVIAGFPEIGCPPLGSYGEWTRLVRAPLVWLGLTDPATSIFERMAVDPDREILGRALQAWRAEFGTSATQVRDVVERAEGGYGPTNAELREVVREIAEERGQVNRRRFGRWISRHSNRIVNGLRFERDVQVNGSERWRVKVMGVMGEVGEQSS